MATLAHTKEEFLLRPDLGRSLSDSARRMHLVSRCPRGARSQVAIADGLSAAAVRAQVPVAPPLLGGRSPPARLAVWPAFFIRHGRVGTLNDIGEILDPSVAVLSDRRTTRAGNRREPFGLHGLPARDGHDDARRNLISNIHRRGVQPEQAAPRIAQLAARMIQLETSGFTVKEETRVETVPIRSGPG